ncbi:MAG: molybdopterin molybdenumtransferase MoeA, partial [Gammaproteobacteria bacterium]
MTESNNPLVEAQERYQSAVPFRTLPVLTQRLEEVLGNTLAEDIQAPIDAPPYHRAIAEGFVVNTEETRTASEDNPVTFKIGGEILPGDEQCPEIPPGQGFAVVTGSILKSGDYSVVRMWDCEREGAHFTVTRPFPPRFFIEDQGCDIARGDIVLKAGTVLGPTEIGTLASLGIQQVPVMQAPRITLFSSGNEVIPYTEPMRPGAIWDCNAPMLSAAIRQEGGIPVFGGIMKDDFEQFVEALKQALAQSDMVVISGGTAVGGRDFVADMVREV